MQNSVAFFGGVSNPYILGGDYRYSFNGMEKDDEIKGNGNSYTTEFRQYDPRVGRWLSLDPLMAKYPYQSPYAAFNNNPIYFVDPYGLEGGEPETNTTPGLDPGITPGIEVENINYENTAFYSSPVEYTPEELDARFGAGFVQNFLPKYIETVTSTLETTNDPDAAIADGVGFVVSYPWKALPDAEGKLTVDLAQFKSAVEYVVDVTYTNADGEMVTGEQFVNGSEWVKIPGFTNDFYPGNNTVRNPGVTDVTGTPNGSRVYVILELQNNEQVYQEVYDKLTSWGATNIQISNMRVELWIWVDLSVIPEN